MKKSLCVCFHRGQKKHFSQKIDFSASDVKKQLFLFIDFRA